MKKKKKMALFLLGLVAFELSNASLPLTKQGDGHWGQLGSILFNSIRCITGVGDYEHFAPVISKF